MQGNLLDMDLPRDNRDDALRVELAFRGIAHIAFFRLVVFRRAMRNRHIHGFFLGVGD
jgi:hypothetical protein